MAVLFVVLATLVVGAAWFGYVIYLTDGFDSERRTSDDTEAKVAPRSDQPNWLTG